MNVLKCSNCGMPVNSSEFSAGLNMRCSHCGHSGIPISSVLYDKAKHDTDGKDVFASELSPESIFSKFAVICFFAFLVSLVSLEMKSFTIASFTGFLMFSAFYGFFRSRNNN